MVGKYRFTEPYSTRVLINDLPGMDELNVHRVEMGILNIPELDFAQVGECDRVACRIFQGLSGGIDCAVGVCVERCSLLVGRPHGSDCMRPFGKDLIAAAQFSLKREPAFAGYCACKETVQIQRG